MNFGASLSSTAIIRTPNLHWWSTLIPLPALSFFNWRTPRIVPLASGLSASMSTSSSSATEPATMEAQAPLAHRRPRKPRQEVPRQEPHLGFETVDAIAESEGISMSTVSFRALFGKGFIGDVPVLLAKPQTFMNASGESVGAISYYKIPEKQVLVASDGLRGKWMLSTLFFTASINKNGKSRTSRFSMAWKQWGFFCLRDLIKALHSLTVPNP